MDAGQDAAVLPSARLDSQPAAVPLAAPSAPADAQSLTTVTPEVTALIPYAPRPTLLCILGLRLLALSQLFWSLHLKSVRAQTFRNTCQRLSQ
jgi:hypothetical protein